MFPLFFRGRATGFPIGLAGFPWRTPEVAAEAVGEVLTGRKPEVQGDFGDGAIRLTEQVHGALQAKTNEVLFGRFLEFLPEQIDEVGDGDPGKRGQFVEFPRVTGMILQTFPGAEGGGVEGGVPDGTDRGCGVEEAMNFEAEGREMNAQAGVGGLVEGDFPGQSLKGWDQGVGVATGVEGGPVLGEKTFRGCQRPKRVEDRIIDVDVVSVGTHQFVPYPGGDQIKAPREKSERTAAEFPVRPAPGLIEQFPAGVGVINDLAILRQPLFAGLLKGCQGIVVEIDFEAGQNTSGADKTHNWIFRVFYTFFRVSRTKPPSTLRQTLRHV